MGIQTNVNWQKCIMSLRWWKSWWEKLHVTVVSPLLIKTVMRLFTASNYSHLWLSGSIDYDSHE